MSMTALAMLVLGFGLGLVLWVIYMKKFHRLPLSDDLTIAFSKRENED